MGGPWTLVTLDRKVHVGVSLLATLDCELVTLVK